MGNLFVSSLFLIFSVLTFTYTYQFSGVTRAFYGVYKGVVETAVQAYAADGTPIEPYFVETLFVEQVNGYFAAALGRYVGDKYEVDYRFNAPEWSTYCEVTLQVPFVFGGFSKTASFQIVGEGS